MADYLVRETVLDFIECEKVGYEISIIECPVIVFEGQFRNKSELDHVCHSMPLILPKQYQFSQIELV